MPRSYTIEAIESAPFAQITYIARLEGSTEAIVVDPGFDVPSIREYVERHGLSVVAILNTHGHVDHIAGNRAMKDAYPSAPLIIGANETHLLSDPEANMSSAFGLPITSPAADRTVAEGETFEVAGFSFEVREIPGHSPGSVVFICDGVEPAFAFVGDVLFAGSVGRTDLGGNTEQLLSGIRAKLWNLPDGMLVLPGHGPTTSIGVEKRTNPYAGVRGV